MKRPVSTSSLSRSVLFVALGALASACNTDPGKAKVQAVVVASAAPVAPPTVGAVNYTFSNDGSKIEFVGAKVTAKHEGSFAAFRGTVALVDGDPTKSVVTAEVDVASLTVQPAKLEGHLKSADFFDAEKFPKARFSSTAIKSGGDNGATHTVTGNLDLHGVTKSLTFPAKIAVSPDQVDVSAEFSINRKDFGVVYPGMPDDLIKDDVLIKLSLHAKK
jgi:polyisoprenoid-binding protein YceI